MSSEQHRIRFLDELEASSDLLHTIESAAIAEAWASGAFVEWLALGGDPGALGDRVRHLSIAAKLIDWVSGGSEPGGEGWLADVGTYEAVRATRLLDPVSPDEEAWILTYEATSGDRHDLSVSIAGSDLASIVVGPEGLADAVAQNQESEFSVDEVDVSLALGRLREVCGRSGGDMSAMSEASYPLLARRLEGVDPVTAMTHEPPLPLPPPDRDEQRYAAGVIRAAMADVLSTDPPRVVEHVVSRCEASWQRRDPDTETLVEIGAVDVAMPLTLDHVLQMVGAYLAPKTFAPHPLEAQRALRQLEPADWIGVVLGLARASVGTEVDGMVLVQAINRCPEVTTSIPKNEAGEIAWAFEQMLYAWEVTGVLEEGAVTETARWLLPHAAIRAWGGGAPAA